MNQNEQTPVLDKDDSQESVKSFASTFRPRSAWLRLFFMLVVFLLNGVSRIVRGAVVVLHSGCSSPAEPTLNCNT